ncbi:hypothetical protein HDU97_007152 [Phlyctochytrium planicorne]|nr:hypothetical protein HDU97_007152 [Phlyctochytrium planicorne]
MSTTIPSNVGSSPSRAEIDSDSLSVASADLENPAELERKIFTAINDGNREALQNIFQKFPSSTEILSLLLTTTYQNTEGTYKHDPDVLTDACELLGDSMEHLNAIQIACVLGDEEIASDILEFVYKVTEEIEARKVLYEFMGRVWGNGNTVLHLASFLGMSDLVKRLIELGANPNKKNERSYKPVDCADDDGTRIMFSTVTEVVNKPAETKPTGFQGGKIRQSPSIEEFLGAPTRYLQTDLVRKGDKLGTLEGLKISAAAGGGTVSRHSKSFSLDDGKPVSSAMKDGAGAGGLRRSASMKTQLSTIAFEGSTMSLNIESNTKANSTVSAGGASGSISALSAPQASRPVPRFLKRVTFSPATLLLDMCQFGDAGDATGLTTVRACLGLIPPSTSPGLKAVMGPKVPPAFTAVDLENVYSPHQWLTPLHIACTHGQIGIVEILLKEANSPVNARDKEGWTPLHCACAEGHIEAIKLLCRAQGYKKKESGELISPTGEQDVFYPVDGPIELVPVNEDEETPEDVAFESKCKEIRKLLEEVKKKYPPPINTTSSEKEDEEEEEEEDDEEDEEEEEFIPPPPIKRSGIMPKPALRNSQSSTNISLPIETAQQLNDIESKELELIPAPTLAQNEPEERVPTQISMNILAKEAEAFNSSLVSEVPAQVSTDESEKTPKEQIFSGLEQSAVETAELSLQVESSLSDSPIQTEQAQEFQEVQEDVRLQSSSEEMIVPLASSNAVQYDNVADSAATLHEVEPKVEKLESKDRAEVFQLPERNLENMLQKMTGDSNKDIETKEVSNGVPLEQSIPIQVYHARLAHQRTSAQELVSSKSSSSDDLLKEKPALTPTGSAARIIAEFNRLSASNGTSTPIRKVSNPKLITSNPSSPKLMKALAEVAEVLDSHTKGTELGKEIKKMPYSRGSSHLELKEASAQSPVINARTPNPISLETKSTSQGSILNDSIHSSPLASPTLRPAPLNGMTTPSSASRKEDAKKNRSHRLSETTSGHFATWMNPASVSPSSDSPIGESATRSPQHRSPKVNRRWSRDIGAVGAGSSGRVARENPSDFFVGSKGRAVLDTQGRTQLSPTRGSFSVLQKDEKPSPNKLSSSDPVLSSPTKSASPSEAFTGSPRLVHSNLGSLGTPPPPARCQRETASESISRPQKGLHGTAMHQNYINEPSPDPESSKIRFGVKLNSIQQPPATASASSSSSSIPSPDSVARSRDFAPLFKHSVAGGHTNRFGSAGVGWSLPLRSNTMTAPTIKSTQDAKQDAGKAVKQETSKVNNSQPPKPVSEGFFKKRK